MRKAEQTVLFVFVVFFCFNVKGQDQEVDDECFTEQGSLGVCKYLTNCQSAKDNIKKGIYPTDICGYDVTQVIVCCVPPRQPTPIIREPPIITRPPPQVITPTPNRVGNQPGDKANAMCQVYSQYAYEKIESPTLSVITTFSKILDCPISTQPLIVGGTKAGRKEFPHMIQIGYGSPDTSWDCGGTLISENFILTAAHCLRGGKGDAKFARGGLANQSDTHHLQVRNIIKLIKHPRYTFAKYHDIALMKVDRNFELNTFLRPACLYTKKDFPVKHAVATGWGLTEFAGEGSEDLQKVILEYFTTSQCNNTYRRVINSVNTELPDGIIEDYMICAGSSEDRKDTCQGDSGGPLQIVHEETNEVKCMYNIIGVTSFGVACGIGKNQPGVYTRVSYYIKWIEDNVWS